MSWKQIYSEDELNEFVDGLKLTDPVYSKKNKSNIIYLRDHKSGEFYIYDNSKYKIFLSLCFDVDENCWCVVNGMPYGDFNPGEAFIVLRDKVFEVLKSKNVSRFYTKSQKKYENEKVDYMLSHINEMKEFKSQEFRKNKIMRFYDLD